MNVNCNTFIQKSGASQRQSEKGSILAYCIVLILALTLGAVFTLNVSTSEVKTAGSTNLAKNQFNNAEAGLRYTIAHFERIYENQSGTGNVPLYFDGDGGVLYDGSVGDGFGDTTDFGTESLKSINDPTIGFVVFDYVVDPDVDPADVQRIARIEVRPILKTRTQIGDYEDGNGNTVCALSDEANNVPLMAHIGPAPGGFDPADYKSRRYAITSTAYNESGNRLTGINVQAGVSVAILKNNAQHLLDY